ncbi:sensor histidine kinase [Parapedobacter indicus]|uniref:histidine kinase n=1 Tax=Parapedobacter indicus TaxID=1477437 RepID=A0A1I3U4V8_9SPHI|nr:HAMP domain-containing sensor histidine kinase [Parapedobacter indicus]PPK99173.1 signal transduction histidine kinase [Parapedobacter indicus]SFJ78544.1 Signal transduction histidine kinase [Parapedobacter indicus]
MIELATITLENEMDLILAYKRSIRTAELLGLTKSTQTVFATAVSEVCREVNDKAFEGIVHLGTMATGSRYFISARITGRVDELFPSNAIGIEYARKLVPVLEFLPDGERLQIVLKLSIPYSARVTSTKIAAVRRQLKDEGPISAYEEIKIRNAALSLQKEQQELALRSATYLNQQKNEFLSVASHELNTPLTVLRSYAQIALRESKDGPLTKYLSKIELQSIKLGALISQLLDISKIENGKMTYEKEVTAASSFLAGCIEGGHLLFPTHDLVVDIDCNCYILIDPIRIEQVINNLLSNAVKYSEPGPVRITTQVDGRFLTISVADAGIGMSEDTQAQVFDKFFRSTHTANTHRGLGIGLYITSQIVNDHGGSIQIKSALGQGTTMSVVLPIVEAPVE